MITQPRMTRHVLVLAIASLFLFSTSAWSQAMKKKPATKKKTTATTKAPSQEAPAPPSDKPSLDVMPKPLASTAFTFPSYEEITLSNGLHVFVIENHDQPLITLNLTIRGGEASDPVGKEGAVSMTADMLFKGTKQHTAAQIAQTLDGVGASLKATAGTEAINFSGSSLKKHAPLLLQTLSEILVTPTFPQDEFEKLKEQMAAGVAYERSRPMELAQALARKVIYGVNSPYARRKTEKTVAAVEVADLSSFHSTWMRPNAASIAIVGDITASEAKSLLEKTLGWWKKADVPTITFPPQEVMPSAVYFIPRKGSVQSSIIVSAAAPPMNAPDYQAVELMGGFIGSGFGSLFFNTLRETYSYTYSPFGFVSRGRRYNRIAVGAEVRSAVTDSAIVVMLREIKKLGFEGPNEQALDRRKKYEVGNYRRLFENPSVVASLLQNAWMNDIPYSEIEEEDKRIEGVSGSNVQEATEKYLNMFNLRLVIVGNPDVRSKLEQFGQVVDFNTDIQPAPADAFEPVSMSMSDVVSKYEQAIGGPAAIAALKTLTTTAETSMLMQGNTMSGTYTRKQKAPNMEYANFDLKVMVQTQWVNGTSAWTSMMNGPAAPAEADETKQLLLDARLFPVLSLKDQKATVKGKQGGMIVVETTAPSGRGETYYFSATTFLLDRMEKIENTPQGPITIVERYEDYAPVEGVMFPKVMKVQNPIYSITMKNTYTGNVAMDDATFVPPTK
jgi:zinc protease